MGMGFHKKVEIDLNSEQKDGDFYVYRVRNVRSKERVFTYVISKKKETTRSLNVNSKPIKAEGKDIYLANI
jgi:hypothetical protein